jgi:S-adenosylmethionine:tRNA ribosyltransferase-isomerase
VETPDRRAAVPTTIDDIDLGFEIPKERIAQRPAGRRGSSRLLVYRRSDGSLRHARFGDLPDLLPPGAVLVLNDTKVVPCRLIAAAPGGAALDLLVLHQPASPGGEGAVEVLARGPKRSLRIGTEFSCGPLCGTLGRKTPAGSFLVTLRAREGNLSDALAAAALMPLPPYIRRRPDRRDALRYQTVYAVRDGSIAAPTAGLHFTAGVLDRIRRRGVDIVSVTLHVGEGTFRPIRTRLLEDHRMQEEVFSIEPAAAARIREAGAAGRPVIAVGTTCVRTLEGVVHETGDLVAWTGSTSLFITPGHAFRIVDGMLTNFHTPRSTPLCLVAALAGMDAIRRAYRDALENGYRFYSYGDAMLIL